ncbi:LysR family transcriptional regulator [Enterococcus sp. AZ109]|uniref:LysR family transcriptional regulator n=1 Tax=Enterococcus sp. AZ109 TaxID=2774634 RepID=UPI003F248B76
MNLQQLRYFLHLAESENMQQTAEDLFVSQPALSKSIRNLESELKVQLFDRIGRRISLNKYGHLFQMRAKRALNELDLGKEEVYDRINEQTGRIDLGFVYSLGAKFIPSLLADFTKSNQINIRGTQNNTKNLLAQLQEGSCDVVFCTENTNYPDLEIAPLYQQPIIFIVGLNHPLSSEKVYSIDELLAYDFISFPDQSTIRPQINRYFANKHLSPKITYEVADDLTLISMASENLGVGIFPRSNILNKFEVREITINESFLTQKICLATNPARHQTPAVIRFIDYVKNNGSRLHSYI